MSPEDAAAILYGRKPLPLPPIARPTRIQVYDRGNKVLDVNMPLDLPPIYGRDGKVLELRVDLPAPQTATEKREQLWAGYGGRNPIYDYLRRAEFADIERRTLAAAARAPHFSLKPGAVNYMDLASRYWPAETEDHQHMHDLTLSPAPKGGYVVTNYDDDVVYAGKLDDCTTFMAEQMEELEDKRADEEAAESAKRRTAEAERLLALEADRIRSEAEKQIAALHIVPAVTAGGGQ